MDALPADWTSVLRAYFYALVQSFVVLDGFKVLIFTFTSPEIWTSANDGQVSRLRWLLRATNGVLALLFA